MRCAEPGSKAGGPWRHSQPMRPTGLPMSEALEQMNRALQG